jgi:membrane peptidoglycan carboxypeptidase
MESHWLWTPHAQAGRTPENPVTNRSTCPTIGTACTLRESTQRGLAVPLYDVTTALSPSKVLETAAGAGIDAIWDASNTRHDLRTEDPQDVVAAGIGLEVGIGQYPVTVVDQANAMATFAAGGLRAQAHFVQQVKKADEVIYAEALPGPDDVRVLSPAQVADLSFVLSQRSGRNDLAVQSGGWVSGANLTDVWSLGYTSQLAAAIWIGNKGAEQALRDSQGASIEAAGLPTYALLQTLDWTQQAMDLTPSAFAPPAYTGDVNPPGSIPS